MNIYDKASLIITPNAYKAGKIYAAKPTSGAGDLTFSRASLGSRRNASGVFESLANNVPPLHYPIGGGCPSWAFQSQRTNLFLNPEAPITQNITVVIGQIYTITTWGTVTATCSGSGVGAASNNGSFTFTASTTTLTVTISGLSGQAYVNCGLGSNIWITPIMSGATATTRNANVATLNSASSLIGQTEGTIFAQLNADTAISGTILQLFLNDDNRMGLFLNGAGSIQAYSRNAGAFTVTINSSQPSGSYKLALAYRENEYVFCINGVQVGTDTSSPVPACNAVHLGHNNGTAILNNILGNTILFNTRLTNAELAALTTL